MMQKQCESCSTVFTYEPNPNYPDKRKYCDLCGAEKKAQWEATQNPVNNASVRSVAPKVPAKGNEIDKETGTFQSTVWNHNVKANSYEVGSAGNRHKIYYETVDDLKLRINELRMAGLLDQADDIVDPALWKGSQ